MMLLYRSAALAGLALGVFALLAGCADKKKVAQPPVSDEAQEIAAAIAQLPEAERAAAEAQKNCPVGGGALGSMGKPYKVTVKGRDVYLCCEGCKGAIESDPDKYLAKLPPATP